MEESFDHDELREDIPQFYDDYDVFQEEHDRLCDEYEMRERAEREAIERAEREEREQRERENAERNTFFYSDDVGDGYDDDGFWH